MTDESETGRVPHVRASVRGPKTMGEAQQSLLLYPPLISPLSSRELVIFFDLWSESFEQHLPASIAEVLRLRAVNPSLRDRSARRFAQDDGFVAG